MGWTYIGNAENSSFGTTVTITATVAVETGDLIVVAGASPALPGGTITISDEDGNSYTLRTQISDDTDNAQLRIGYAIAEADNATNTVTVETSAGNLRRNIKVGVFRPGAGESVTLADSGTKEASYEASPFETGTFDAADGDLCVAFIQALTNNCTSQEIPSGTAATALGTAAYNSLSAFYTILSGSSITGGVAESEWGAATRYAAECLVFRAAAAGTIVPVIAQMMRRRRQ